ncbi:MAG: MipA/OmpV family protein [Oxalobacteraceae bacterium]|nr:MAG: MipA/OmpV family protein [Oxalobacteraceae bacterium]
MSNSPDSMFWTSLLLFGAMAIPAAAQVAAPAEAPADVGHWGVGVGLNLKQQSYKGMGTKTNAIPLLSYENRWLRLAGPAADFKVPLPVPVTLALRARYAFEDGFESSESRDLYDMAKRKSSFWLGAALGWHSELVNASAELLIDASGHSKGKRARTAVDKPLRAGAFLVAPRLALNWVDRDYVNYYYGVRPNEARQGRPAYMGGSALNPELGLRVAYRLGSYHSMYVDGSVTRLDDVIQDSPLVGRKTESALRLGYLYQFR